MEDQRRSDKLTGKMQIDESLITHDSANCLVDPDEWPNIHDRKFWVFGLISDET